jgi:hypothetical protein
MFDAASALSPDEYELDEETLDGSNDDDELELDDELIIPFSR